MGFNWAALQLVAWTGMTVQNARTMDWDTALERAVAGQQSCMICRLIDDRQGTGKPKAKPSCFKAWRSKACCTPPPFWFRARKISFNS